MLLTEETTYLPAQTISLLLCIQQKDRPEFLHKLFLF